MGSSTGVAGMGSIWSIKICMRIREGIWSGAQREVFEEM